MPPQPHPHKMARPVFKPREILFCQYEYDQPAKSCIKKLMRYKKPSRVHLKNAKCLLRTLSRLGGKETLPKQYSKETQTVHEPIKLGQRIILRRRFQSPQKLVALHKFYQDAESLANEELNLATTEMDPASELSVAIRLGIRAKYEE